MDNDNAFKESELSLSCGVSYSTKTRQARWSALLVGPYYRDFLFFIVGFLPYLRCWRDFASLEKLIELDLAIG